jgi:hypothetical protein
MNMNQDSENFEDLRRLLAVKRHEQPPPGYFHNFSRQVCARIEAGERATDFTLGSLFPGFSWLQQSWASFQTKPVFAGLVGAVACTFLLVGIVYSTENAASSPEAYAASPAIEASLGIPSRPSHKSVFEPSTLADFQLSNAFGTLVSQSSLFPVQQVNFVQGN